jgi:hypothetical protein
VDWKIEFYEFDSETETHKSTYIQVHPCTNDELEQKFYEVEKTSQNEFNQIKDAGGFFCINEIDENGNKVDLEFFGNVSATVSSHKILSIIFDVCTPEELTAENAHLRDSKCIAPLEGPGRQNLLEEAREYLESPVISFLSNTVSFNS